ncbi:MAG TPA: M14 family zinc carboxypeptidase [Gemmatimonadaceae bacterium]|nr:M14 family zinc carboxypeptidase [Gemmatimonadaceae bacterium]
MRILLAAALLAGCAQATPTPDNSAMPIGDATRHGLRAAEQHRVATIASRRFTHEEFWRAVQPSLSSDALRTAEIGRSLHGREIRSVTFGNGSTTVLLWSQMHGDEATATMALADIFRFLAEARGDPVRERLRERLTIVFVPMLNPDGAELFQRENAVGIDINRDARQLATPEGRALKALRDRIRPAFGFNLHDQGARVLAGPRGKQVALALLAPPSSESGVYDDVRSRARLVAGLIAQTLGSEIPGRIARYDDTFNPRAFGDLMQQWGTSTVLIESGALPDDPDKQRLRTLNVVALLAALDAIATGRYASVDVSAYESLPGNRRGAADVLVMGGQLVLPGRTPVRADVAINYDDAVGRTGGRVADVGDLREAIGIDTVDADGLFLHPGDTSLTSSGRDMWLRIGAAAIIDVRRRADPGSELVRTVGGGRASVSSP